MKRERPYTLLLLGAFFLLITFLLVKTFSSSHTAAGAASSSPLMSRIKISKTVLQALQSGRPVVALESTVITHGGLGYPRNLETGRALEEQITRSGAVPATIAIMNGFIRVGLEPSELEFLAQNAASAVKCSRRDLGPALALKWTGSTTVAATMFAAHAAGIDIFATGGLGGVHRGAFSGKEPSLDVSADLTELAQTPVTVVCAGVKSILDVVGTLEWLETSGVPVASLDSAAFPQFFTQSNQVKSPLNLKSIQDVAGVIKANKDLGLQSGMVLAVPNKNPVPGIESLIEVAVEEGQRKVSGKDVTPFVLRRVAELSEGRSIASNIELLMNNARVAGAIAVEYSKLKLQK